MKHLLITVILLFAASGLFAQQQVVLTEDLVISETLEYSVDTDIVGNGFKIICNGCDPVIRVVGNAHVNVTNVFFPRVYTSWIAVLGQGGSAAWNSSRMVGSINWNGSN